MCVTNDIPLGCTLPLTVATVTTVATVNSVQILKAMNRNGKGQVVAVAPQFPVPDFDIDLHSPSSLVVKLLSDDIAAAGAGVAAAADHTRGAAASGVDGASNGGGGAGGAVANGWEYACYHRVASLWGRVVKVRCYDWFMPAGVRLPG